MIQEIMELGFSAVELGYDLTLDLVPGVKKLVDQKAVTISSLHNFCPVPTGAPFGHPELFPLTSLDRRTRESGVIHTKRTIDFAAEMNAGTIVAHAGNVEIYHYTRDLIELCLDGVQYNEEYEKTKMKLITQREKKVKKHLDQLYRSLDELLPYLTDKRVKLGLENLPSWESIPSETEMEEILRRYDSPFLGYWHDMGHGQIRQNLGFISHKRWFERLLPRLCGIHIHDVVPPTGDHVMPPKGKIMFADFKSVAQSGGVLVLEPAPGLPAADIQEGMRVVRDAWSVPPGNQ
jgi:sugar phosphate isomerase/epimerase